MVHADHEKQVRCKLSCWPLCWPLRPATLACYVLIRAFVIRCVAQFEATVEDVEPFPLHYVR